MDLTKIKLIHDSNKENLLNENYLEKLIIQLGFNNLNLDEQPLIVKNNIGGLLIGQYPNQFSKYLLLLQKYNINSYMEIGCRNGGTFVLTTEYLKKFNNIKKAVAIDINDSPVIKYCLSFSNNNNDIQFIKIDTQNELFKKYMINNCYDLVFLDGDRTYKGIQNDFELCQESKIIVFHDIISDTCLHIIRFWNELKNNNNNYNYYEFTDQYEEVYNKTKKKLFGIGVAIKK